MKAWRWLWSVVGVVLLVAAALASCGDDDIVRIEGSGNVVTEERSVEGFDSIALLGSGDVIVELGGEERLTVEADDNLLQYLVSEVRGDRLELKTESNTSLGPSSTITYRIIASELEEIQVRGSGDVSASGIDTRRFEVSVNGSGSVRLSGTADKVDFNIPGSGRIDGTDLSAADGDVRINGSGNITVNATDRLDIAINGSGNVGYLGDPEVDQSINGSGDISRLE